MKLYATVTSERASKGQGGNKFLDVAVLVGDARTQREVIRLKAKTFLDSNGVESYAILGSWHGATEQEKVLHTGTIKGERQKGECVYHGVVNCSRCDDFKR